MKKLGFIFLFALAALAGCSSAQINDAGATNEPLNGIIAENKTIPIEYVQHIDRDEYDIGYVYNDSKELVWYNTDRDLISNDDIFHSHLKFTAVVEENIGHSYLERKKDENNRAVFILHIAKNNIEGGKISRTCGKGCVENIPTQIISK